MSNLKLIPVAALLTLPDTAIRLALALADAADAEGRVTLAPPGAGEAVAGLSRPTFYRAGVSLISTGLATRVGNDWTLSWLAGGAAETVESAAETVAADDGRAEIHRKLNECLTIAVTKETRLDAIEARLGKLATALEVVGFDVDRALKRSGSALAKVEEHDEELLILLRAHRESLATETPEAKPPTPPAPLPAVAATLPIPFGPEPEPAAPVAQRSLVISQGRMSNRQYHAAEKPKWWVKIGSAFQKIPDVRGDGFLRVEVDLPPGTKVEIGTGPRGQHGIREDVTTVPIVP